MRVPLLVLACILILPGLAGADSSLDADALFRKAAGQYNQGRPDSAIALLEQALSLYGDAGLPGKQVEVLNWLGLIEYYRASYAPAEKRFQDALALARESGRGAQIPGILNNLGLVRYAQGGYDDAVSLYRAAYDEQVKAGDHQAAAQSLGNIASVYLSWAHYPEAEQSYRQALEAFEKAGDKANAANTHLNLGILYATWAKYDQARAELEDGMAQAGALGLRQSEAYGLGYLGRAYYGIGRYDLAEQAYLRALGMDRELNLRLNVVSVSSSLGEVYQAWGRNDRAMELYKDALSSAEQLGVPDQAVDAAYHIGSTLQAEGRYDEAIAQLADALARAQRLGREPVKLPILEALGTANFLKKNFDEAEPWFRRAYELAVRLGQQNMAARQLIHLGGIDEVSGRGQAALQKYTMALDMCRAAGLKSEEAVVRNNLGLLYLDARSYDDAEGHLLQAIALKEELRKTATGRARMDFLAEQLSSYRWLVTTRIRKGDAAGAFDAAELMKARWLGEELGAQAGHSAAPFTGILGEQGRLDPKLLVVSFAGIDADHPAVIAVTRDTVRAVEITIPSAAEGAAAAASPAESSAAEQPPTRGFILTRAPRKFTGLADRVEAYRRLLALSAPTQAERAERVRMGHELFEMLLAPVQKEMEGKDAVLVVPDGSLCALPFEALLLPDGRWLVEGFHVTYVPSFAVKALLEGRRTLSPGPRSLLALGGALYQGAAALTAPRVSDQQLASLRLASEDLASRNRSAREIYSALGLDGWEDLPGTRAEVSAIQALLPGGMTLTGADASENRIKQMSRDGTLARFSVIHFATHGIAVPEAPDLSALILSQGESEGTEDGYLTTREIAGLKLNADFVNLSACETGMGKILGGEGVVGLSEAFLTAGANSLSVSLWQVSDEGTREFMTGLYRAVRERGLSWARAMTEMKRAFIRGGAFREPFYWAPFVYYGS
jgi:CHAT domain-containing protein/tetratricopeptide (TPR) repeat protein